LQSIEAAVFYEQVKNIENSKASILEVISGMATVKSTTQDRKSDIHIKRSKIYSKKLEEAKDRECD